MMIGVYTVCFHIALIAQIVDGWSWTCNSGNCGRVPKQNGKDAAYPTLELCHLVCGSNNSLNLWPYPTGKILSSKEVVIINQKNINFDIFGPEEVKAFLESNIDYFKRVLRSNDDNCEQTSYIMDISLNSLTSDMSLGLDTDESYTLHTTYNGNILKVQIVGSTVYGVRHGLETLLQLLVPYGENTNCLATLNFVQIEDKPTYRHRGLLLDTARNYLSVKVIKKNIDGMAASKMNVLHWHITDSQSFPLVSPSLPNMTRYGAYGEKSIYTPSDITYIIEYAKLRGVKVLMEIDGPSHAGFGWQWGPEAGLGNLAVCINKQPWRSFCIQPPCGQLNPANPNLYRILQYLYKDISNVVPDADTFHMGGDEVFMPCWNSTQEIIDYLKGKPLTEETFLNLWGEFQSKATAAFDAAVGHSKTSVILWTSHLTDPNVIEKYLPKNRYIIQTWVTEAEQDLIKNLLKLGYKLILSTKDRWYLDHGFWGSTNYYNWRRVYENKMYSYSHPSILGGEVCMWGELVDDSNIESRIWPRAAAAAERLWTNPSNRAGVAEARFYAHRERLVGRGIKAQSEIPRWCIQNEGACSTYL